MPTHQSLGASAEQLLLRIVTTHSERYGQDYWGAFDAGVAPPSARKSRRHRTRLRPTPLPA